MLRFININNRKVIDIALRLSPGIGICIIALFIIDRFGGLRFEQILFALILPFTLRKAYGQGKPSYYILSSITLYFVFFVTNVYSIFYLASGLGLFACLFVIDQQPTFLSIILLGTSTPAVKYLLSVFSFPIKLHLSQLSGKILSIFYSNINISGNCIYKGDIEFTVAQECLGLSMISTALAFTIFVLAFISSNAHKTPPFYLTILFLITSIALVTTANLSRIVLTIILNALPGTLMHELIGVLLFISNCCFPIVLMGWYLKRHFKNIKNQKIFKRPVSYLAVIIPLIALGSFSIEENKLKPKFSTAKIELEGFSKVTRVDNIVKLQNKESLIYIKPPAFTLGSDHNPFICWKASGYDIKNEQQITLGNHKAYSFELRKHGEQTLYSCWWYTNGANNTISQLEWRIAMLKGELPYCVVNATSTDKVTTTNLTNFLLNNNIFN